MASEIRIDKQDYKKLVNGKFKSFRCTMCAGHGWYWVHEDGTIRSPKWDEPADAYYQHPCEECNELGFNVVFDED